MDRPFLLDQITLTLRAHKICGLLGPRQSGKTTLARMYAEKHYEGNYYLFDLENPADLNRLENPLLAFSQVSQRLIIIDEIQRKPDLFPILRVINDDPQSTLIFLILGSASRELIMQSSESLAGRIGYIDVLPFSLQEVKPSEKLWVRGGFPRSFLAHTNEISLNWRQNYIKTFLEQDIPNLGFQIPPQQMRRFWMMLAHYHGQILNGSELGRSLGVTHHTIRRYIDILEATFMIRVLQPWFENIDKRQIKSPKIYFRDSGILHTLLGIEQEEYLYVSPKVGASWEGFALEETVRMLQKAPAEVFFWAAQSTAELDLLLIKDGKKIGFEYKYADVPRLTKSMHTAAKALGLDHLYIVTPGQDSYILGEGITACGLDVLDQLFK